ncbi:MAG: hypothetical protein FJ144_20830 [Deltaproteobacteria bacterium]|nr:hypothetical protein [Deltaproteobacteria bacterium]
MRGLLAGLLLVLAVVLAVAFAGRASAQTTLETPLVVGDQLFFVYDTSGPRVAFVNLSNPSAEAVELEVSFYPFGGGRPEARFALGPFANHVVNPLDVAGVAGTRGMIVVTPVAGPESAQPIVPPAPLAGTFTQANTTAGAAFGGNPVGRLAVLASGERAAPGAPVDGTTVRYQRFTPPALTIATYYDPTTLDPPEVDGNRVILVTFEDGYGARFDPVAPATARNLDWVFFDNEGGEVGRGGALATAMILDRSLRDLAAPRTLTSSGKAFFAYDTSGGGNVFGFFLQSLAAFGAGEHMPAVAEFPG